VNNEKGNWKKKLANDTHTKISEFIQIAWVHKRADTAALH